MIRFLALGAPELRGDDAAELRSVLTQPRLLALLTYLAVAQPRGFRRRDSLVALLWPELGHESARNALRQVLHRLRRALGESALASRGVDELGIVHGEIWCDVLAFEEALDAGKLSEALALYRGDLLPGFFTSDAPEFERWLDEERTRLRHRAAAAAWLLVEQEAKAGRADTALHWARWAAALQPDDEAASRRLIELQLRAGDRGGALRSHETLVRRLAEEFDTTPSPETQALVRALQDTTIPARTSPPAIEAAGAVPALPGLPEVRPRHRSRWTPALAAAWSIAVIATTAVVIANRGAAADTPKTVAVFPFAVRGSTDFAYLGDGMIDLLSAKIEGGSGFRAIDPRSVVAAIGHRDESATDLAASASLARRLGANWLIRGEVLEIAGRLHLSATMYDIARAPRQVATSSVAGEGTALFQLVDDLVGRLLATAAPGRDSAVTSLAAQTTQSLAALKAFLEGEQTLRAGREAEAGAAFREATTLDSTFALAQYRLALTATWTIIRDVPDPTARAALAARYATRLSPLGRDLVRAYQAYKEVRVDSAENAYREITRGHPDNVEAWLLLGETYFHYNSIIGRSPSEAREPFERVLTLEPYNPHALLHLARLAAYEGRITTFDSIARVYRAHHSDADRILEMRALEAYLHDDGAERNAVANLSRVSAELTRMSILQDAVLFAQNLDGASELKIPYLASTRYAGSRRYGGRLLSEIPFAKGNWGALDAPDIALMADERDWRLETEALLAAEPMYGASRARLLRLRDSLSRRRSYPTLSIASQPPDPHQTEMRDYLLGILNGRLGDTAAAARHAEALGRITGARAEIASGLAHSVRAEILRSAGDLRGALREVEAFPLTSFSGLQAVGHWGSRERFVHGELLVALGRDREALPWYDAAFHGYGPWIPASHLRRGEITERLGDLEAAKLHYSRAAKMWKDADPEFAFLLKRATDGLARVSASAAR